MICLQFVLDHVRCENYEKFIQIWYEIIVRISFLVDFMKQLPEGLVCFFTIKNPSYPDYISKNNSNKNPQKIFDFFYCHLNHFLLNLLNIVFLSMFHFNSYNRKWCNVLRYSSKLSIFTGDWYGFHFYYKFTFTS